MASGSGKPGASRKEPSRLRVGAEECPYVVIRWMPGVASVVPIRVVSRSIDPPDAKVLVVVDDDAIENGLVSSRLRTKIVEAAASASRRDGFRRCVVFGPTDCVYVRSDGTGFGSKEPPSGGLRLDSVDVRDRSSEEPK